MSTMYSRSRRRAGMTLIEILVVIAIIAILAALLLAAVVGVFSKGYEAQNRSDILNLSTSLQRFYADKKFYPPDQLLLHKNYTDYAADGRTQLADQSLVYIALMWPDLGQFVNIHWAGTQSNGQTPVPIPGGGNGGFILEGDQCLVFFLGGPPMLPNGLAGLPLPAADVNSEGAASLMGGFVRNPVDPIYLGPYTNARKQLDRTVKYFDFDKGRLFYRNAASPFPSYRDAYPGQGPKRPPSPFVYFSNYRMPNGYISVNLATGAGAPNTVNGVGIYPYKQTATTFYNANTFQIISAGQDGQLGTGGLWPPVSGKANVDDFSNFWDKQLGSL